MLLPREETMSFLQQLQSQIGSTLEILGLGSPAAPILQERSGTPEEPTIKEAVPLAIVGAVETETKERTKSERSVVTKWILNDMLFVAMLLLTFVGVIMRFPVIYWIVLTPIFGLISIVEGWSHFSLRSERLGLAYRVAAIWGALLVAIYLLYNGSVQGVMNANATSLAMIIILALGTFVAGVQARVWQICAVGGLLFLAVPGVGWLDQSPLLLTAVTVLLIGLAGLVWWIKQMQTTTSSGPKTVGIVPTPVSQAQRGS
jgi:hypothetical protein